MNAGSPMCFGAARNLDGVARHLGIANRLSEPESRALDDTIEDWRSFRAREDIVREGAASQVVHLLVSGWACRYKLTADGGRQIPVVFLPGGICDLNRVFWMRADYDVAALTPCNVMTLSRPALTALLSRHPGIAVAFGALVTRENAILTEHAVSLGRRAAHERLAHLLCEFGIRLAHAGGGSREQFDMPLTQEQLADILGLTSVHVNRMLQLLRSQKLIELHRNRLTILDWDELAMLAGFDPAYLESRDIASAGAVSGLNDRFQRHPVAKRNANAAA